MNSPGCFGVPSVSSPKSSTCNKCDCFSRCIAKSAQTLELLPESEGKKSLKAQYEMVVSDMPFVSPELCMSQHIKAKTEGIKRPLTEQERDCAKSLPVNVKRRYEQLIQSGSMPGISRALQSGINPFPLRENRFMHVAFSMLLDGSLTRQSLKLSYIETLGWSDGTAASQSSVAWSLLPAIGVVTVSNGVMKIAPNLRSQNSV